MRTLVTGATGFVGSNLVRRLAHEGWDVHVLVRPTSDLRALGTSRPHITVHEHRGDMKSMRNAVSSADPSVVFHLAAHAVVEHHAEDVVPLIESNVLLGAELLEAMAQHGVHRLINTSTFGQHYDNRDYSPQCLYAATKRAFEALLQFYLETSPLQAVTLTLFDNYGPSDPRSKLFRLLRDTAEREEPLAMTPGEQLIDLVYIDDVVEAYVCAAKLLETGLTCSHERYAVSSGCPIRLKDLVSTYEHVLGRELNIRWGGKSYRPREIMVPWNRGRRLPGWKPRVALSEGMGTVVRENQPRTLQARDRDSADESLPD